MSYFILNLIFNSNGWNKDREAASSRQGYHISQFNICNICADAGAGANAWLDAQPSALRSPQGSSTPPPPDPPDMPGINRAGLLSLR